MPWLGKWAGGGGERGLWPGLPQVQSAGLAKVVCATKQLEELDPERETKRRSKKTESH